MTTWRIWFAVAALASGGAAVAACTDDGSADGGGPSVLPGADGGGTGETSTPDDGGAPPDGSAAAFCDSTFGVVRRALERCCSAGDKSTKDYALQQAALGTFEPACTSTIDASLTKGRVAFHADQASICYGAYASNFAAGPCVNITQTFSSPAGKACDLVFSGTGAEGAACAGDHECNDGLTCVGYTKTSDGACHAPGAIGAACGAQRVDGGSTSLTIELNFGTHPACASGARCSATSTCVAAAASGGTCVTDEDCASPLLCHLHVCGSAGPAAAGGACKTASDCVRGLFCDRPNADGVCATKRPAGGACTGPAFGNVTECAGRCDADAGAAGSCASFCGSP